MVVEVHHRRVDHTEQPVAEEDIEIVEGYQ